MINNNQNTPNNNSLGANKPGNVTPVRVSKNNIKENLKAEKDA
jgi:hypothetical protein